MVRLLVAALVFGIVGTAAADSESAKLFEEGRALAKDQKWTEACATFDKSLELDRASGTLVNLADCQEHLGHLALAWRLFDEAARLSDKEGNVDRAKFSRDRGQALVPKTSTIVVKLAQPDLAGLNVMVAGQPATVAPEIREVVDPGDVTIEVNAPNHRTFTKQERAEAGLRIVVEVPKLEAVGDSSDGGGELGARRRSRVVAAYAMAGVGAASVITGILIGVSAKNKYNAEYEGSAPNCTRVDGESRCNDIGKNNQLDAIARANIGTVFGVGGALLVAAGAVVYLTAPRDVAVIPTATASAGGLAVVGRF
jgi:hypothetical protein